jgi:hypothetical protein
MNEPKRVEDKLVPVQLSVRLLGRTIPSRVLGYTYDYVLSGWVAGQVRRFPLVRRNVDESVDADFITEYFDEQVILELQSSHTEEGVEQTALEPEMEGLVKMMEQIGQGDGIPVMPVDQETE